MTYLALSLYALGLIGAVSAVSDDGTLGLRKWLVCIGWPVAVAAGLAWGALDAARAIADTVRGRA